MCIRDSHCGGLNVKVTYRSAAGHTSIPHPEGADALEKTVNAAAALMALGRRISRYSEELGAWSKLSVTMIESGNTVNMYPSCLLYTSRGVEETGAPTARTAPSIWTKAARLWWTKKNVTAAACARRCAR